LSEKIKLTPKILDLQQSNDIYMSMKMIILSNQINYNNAQFTDDFIQGVINEKNKYISIPLVVNRTKLENQVYNSLSHEYSDGELKTDVVGSFVDFWSETDDTGALCLLGEIRVYKRYPNTCSAIYDLYSSSLLEFSCEVIIYEYLNTENNVRKIHYNNGLNQLFGSCIVSNAAEERSKPTLLIAEALDRDLLNFGKGGENLSEVNKEVFNKGNQTKRHGQIENSELSFDDIESQIYNILNPVDPQTNDRQYNYWTRETFQTYVIVEDWNNSEVLFKINYSISGEIVSVDPKEQWIPMEQIYQPKGTDIQTELNQKSEEVIQLNAKVEELNNLAVFAKEGHVKLEEQIKELQEKLDQVTKEFESKIETITKEFETKVAGLEQEKTELNEFKVKWETHDKEVKVKELNDKYSKLISEDVWKTEEVQNAIKELNESVLKDKVIEEMSNKMKEVETASKGNDDVTIHINENGKDLIPEKSLLGKYGIE
jgi:hypothetical protein